MKKDEGGLSGIMDQKNGPMLFEPGGEGVSTLDDVSNLYGLYKV